MIDKEHTPGPWEIREVAHEKTPWSERRVYRVEIVAPLTWPITGKRYGSHRICEIIDYASFTSDPKNAALIVSAPKMHETLKAIRDDDSVPPHIRLIAKDAIK